MSIEPTDGTPRSSTRKSRYGPGGVSPGSSGTVTESPPAVGAVSRATERMSVVVTWVAVEALISRALRMCSGSGVGIVAVCPRASVGGAFVIVGRPPPWKR